MDCGELTYAEAKSYVDRLPSFVDRATATATEKFKRLMLQQRVNEGNFGEMAEHTAHQVVYSLRLNTENELVDLDLFHVILEKLLELWPYPSVPNPN